MRSIILIKLLLCSPENRLVLTNKAFLFLSLMLAFSACHDSTVSDRQILRPAPTTGTLINYGEEEGGKGDARRAWEEKVHRAAPELDWRAIEYQNSMDLHRRNNQSRRQGLRSNDLISIANGQVEGNWKERGASNVAGSVHDLAYDVNTDAIYTVADGGSMWRLDLEEFDWTLINQELHFNRGLLELATNPDGGQRIVALIARTPHFSDDGGLSWSPSEMMGISFDPGWANVKRSIVANDGHIYLLAKEDYWADYKLFVSNDQGSSFQMIYAPASNNTLEDILKPNHGDELLLLRRNSNTLLTELVSTINDTIITINSTTGQGVVADPKLLGTYLDDGDLKLMIYGDDEIHESLDTGRNWTYVGDLPSSPWNVGLHMSKANPDYLILGNVNLYYSEDGGSSWEQGAYWADYYDDVVYKLHADMMYFKDFQRPDSSYSTFVSSHGGLSINTDDPTEYLNLSLGGLNNAQYYSTATKRGSEDRIFAGSQDQGLQFQTSDFAEVENFDQVISGDYGNLSYSHTSDRLYSMYPFGGLLTWKTETNQYLNWTDIGGADAFGWITPFMVVPDPNAAKGEILYVAGGNADGGSGSHLVRAEDLSANPTSVDYALSNASFAFNEEAGGIISSVGYSPVNPQRLYVGTENGRFYRTDNSGTDWIPTINFLPEGFYLYGQAIMASSLDSNRVWFGGSGYSNPAVYQSDDAGEVFYSISDGLPPTVVMRMAANNDESLLFAATESGPYVYVVADSSWYYLGGLAAPAGRYYSVEFLPNSNIARFASYNRGVWDFEISEEVSLVNKVAMNLPDWTAYPNPTNGPIRIKDLPVGSTKIKVTGLTGRLVLTTDDLDLGQQPAGIYLLTPENAAGQATGRTKRVVVIE